METPQVSLWIAPILDEVSCLAMFISCTGGRLVIFVKEIKTVGVNILWNSRTRLDMFDSSMYVATTSTLTWCIVVEWFFSLQLPSFGSSPKTIACFMHASGYYKQVFLRIYDGFAVPLQLVFLQFLTKFMKGLVRWVLPLLLYVFFSLWIHADS